VSDITEGTVFGLGVAQVINLDSFGVASSVVLGTARDRRFHFPASALSTGSVGSAKTLLPLSPTGVAAGGGIGTPRLTVLMSPDGVASTEAFGDADTVATVFIIPGPVDPSNDFGTVTVTRNGWVFRTPRTTYQWRLFKDYEGVSLLREDGVWSEVQHPDLERTLAAQLYLSGGRDHFVDDTTKAELIALGYTVTEELIP